MYNTITAMIWRKEKKLEQIVETRKLEAEDDDDGGDEKKWEKSPKCCLAILVEW